MFTIHSDNLSRFGYAREAAFGTAIAVNQAFKEIIVPRGVYIDPGIKKSDLDLNRSTRVQQLSDIYMDDYSGLVTVTIPEMYLTKDRASDFLFAATQYRVSEGAADCFAKIFRMHASQPDFTANAGYFFTLAWRGAITAKHVEVASCIIRKMTIDFDKSGDGDTNLVRFRNVEIIGKKMTQGKTYSGTWTAPSIATAYVSAAFSLTFATYVLPWKKFSITIDNGAAPLEKNSDGTPRTFYLNPPKPGSVIVEFDTWYNADTSTSYDFLAALKSNAQLNCVFKNAGTVATDGFFSITVNGVIDGNPQGSDNKQMVCPVKLLCGDIVAGTTDAVQFDIADSISQG